jgi:hypothetical protein
MKQVMLYVFGVHILNLYVITIIKVGKNMSLIIKPIETKTIHLRPGLHLLTYVDAADQYNPPLVNINVPMGLVGSRVSMMFLDANNEGFLNQPNDTVVIRVIGESAELSIGILVTTECKSAEIKLKTEYLLGKEDDLNESSVDDEKIDLAPVDEEGTEKILPLSFSGHVEWQGDVHSSAGEGLGSPEKNWRIENFAIHWPEKPEGIDIEYRCHVKSLGETLKTSLDGFVGTKARALPITALSAQLVGLGSENYELVIQVMFSETGLRTITADGEFIWGIHENEFLTGIRGFVKQKTVDVDKASVNENKWSNASSASSIEEEKSDTENTWANSSETSVVEKQKTHTITSPIQKNTPSNIISF